MTEPSPSGDGRTVTVRVPISIRRRGGRKLVLAPDGAERHRRARHAATSTTPWSRRSPGRSAGATCWRAASTRPFAEIAAAEKINESYVGRVLRLTLLAPDIVEAILDGRQPAGLQLEKLLRPFSVLWRDQSNAIPHMKRSTAA